MNITDILDLIQVSRALEEALPPSPWTADINEVRGDFTGTFSHPPCPHTASMLHDSPELAEKVATMRNLFPKLLEVLAREDRIANALEKRNLR